MDRETRRRWTSTAGASAAIAARYKRRSRNHLRSLQMIFQNADSALIRRHSVGLIILRSMLELAKIRGETAEAGLRDLAGLRSEAEAGSANRYDIPIEAPRRLQRSERVGEVAAA